MEKIVLLIKGNFTLGPRQFHMLNPLYMPLQCNRFLIQMRRIKPVIHAIYPLPMCSYSTQRSLFCEEPCQQQQSPPKFTSFHNKHIASILYTSCLTVIMLSHMYSVSKMAKGVKVQNKPR